MGWLTDKIDQALKVVPYGKKSVDWLTKPAHQAVASVAGAIGWTGLQHQAERNKREPVRALGRAATATAAWYLGAAAAGGGSAGGGSAAATSGGYGGGGLAGGAAGGAAGGLSASSIAGYGGLALNAYQALAARNAMRDGPGVPSAIHMPNPEETAAARRRKTAEIMRRSGRASTILSDSETLG